MKIVDLSHTIKEGMPVFPGTEAMSLERPFTIEQDGFAESRLTMFSHVGTHMDAPYHMIAQGKTLDAFPVSQFVGNALVMDFSDLAACDGEQVIGLDLVQGYQSQMEGIDFVLIYTGWSRLWGQENYYKDFPSLSVEAARWLVDYPLKGIGIDAISIDAITSQTFPVHQIILSRDMVIIENLTNLEPLLNSRCAFSALPLKFQTSDGAPVRAIGSIQA